MIEYLIWFQKSPQVGGSNFYNFVYTSKTQSIIKIAYSNFALFKTKIYICKSNFINEGFLEATVWFFPIHVPDAREDY